MKVFTVEEQRKRLENLRYADESVKKCANRVRIHDYIPAQVTYNVGSYPAKFSIKPTEYDYELIKSLSEKGVGLIQIHEEWNDSIRKYGADKFSSHDPEGMREFIDLCHKFGIKVLPYISTCFFDVRDKDFKPEFMEYNYSLDQLHFRYAMNSLKSPEWSEYVYRKIANILEEYDVDGLYNDMGHDECCHQTVLAQQNGTDENELVIPYEPCAEDMLARLYSLVNGKGKIMKLHYSRSDRPTVKDKVYDYLWVGEAISDINKLRKTVSYDPYIVPCPDFNVLEDSSQFEIFYAQFLPLMQFPLRADGRPYDAMAKISVPDVEYAETYVTQHCRNMAKFISEHPNGPHMYSEWSSIPDNEEYRERWFYYLNLYKPMVEENNVCYLDIKDSTLTKKTPSDNICMSLFTGVEQYICISNLGKYDETVAFNDRWEDCETGEPLTELVLSPNRVRFLKKMI